MKTTLSIIRLSHNKYQVLDGLVILKTFTSNLFGTASNKAEKFLSNKAHLYC